MALDTRTRRAPRESQRARIVRAMLECVGREGYEATTVPQVVATAAPVAALISSSP